MRTSTLKRMGGSGLALAPLRWVIGWLFFSALWRRMVLSPSKLDVWSPGSLAEKTNHFLPHAIDPTNTLEWTLRHPDVLAKVLLVMTLVEGLAGLLLLLGLLTRVAGLVTVVLSGVILLSAGWLGTTCLDEWQIGVLGIAGGAAIVLSGADGLCLDALLPQRWRSRTSFSFLVGGQPAPVWLAVTGSIATLGLTLWTNQVFHGGLWGTLHNLSAKPHVELYSALAAPDGIEVDLMRDEGPDTHGAFVVAVELLDGAGHIVQRLVHDDLTALPKSAIENRYIAQVETGPFGLVLPLGARATVTLPFATSDTAGLSLRWVEVSGRSWTVPVSVPAPTSCPAHRRAPGHC